MVDDHSYKIEIVGLRRFPFRFACKMGIEFFNGLVGDVECK